jgi:hypothetical protein
MVVLEVLNGLKNWTLIKTAWKKEIRLFSLGAGYTSYARKTN